MVAVLAPVDVGENLILNVVLPEPDTGEEGCCWMLNWFALAPPMVIGVGKARSASPLFSIVNITSVFVPVA